MSEDLNKHLDAAIETLEALVSEANDDIGAAHQEGGKATEADHDRARALYSQLRAVTDLRQRLQAAEERAEKLDGAMLNVQQQCENVVFNLSQCPYHPLANSDAVRIFGRMTKTLRLAALKTEGA